jgi:phage tail-like protein
MPRDVPYGAFNFVVAIGGDDANAGFSEVSGLGTEMTMAEYRAGNSRVNHVIKVPGLHRTTDVTLKRGVINSGDLWSWLEDVRTQGPAAKRDVSITLLDETHEQEVQKWKLPGAFPLKYTGPSLNASGADAVAIEEFVLACDSLRLEQAAG